MRQTMAGLAVAAMGMLAALGATGAEAAAQRTDSWITSQAKFELLTAERVNGLDVYVDTIHGEVTLHGEVGSDAERAEAERIVRTVEGVTGVRNLLTVRPPVGPGNVDQAGRVDDATLRSQLEDAFEEDWDLDGIDVDVESVVAGVVVLEGEAETLGVKHRAIALTRNFPGVVRVVDQIEGPDRLTEVELWGTVDADGERNVLDDGWITTKVKLALMAADDVPALEVNVDTFDRVVTLFGTVPDEGSRLAAEAAARSVDGVVRVSNLIQIVPESREYITETADEVVADRVEEALDAAPVLDGADLQIEVENGIVRLTGELEAPSHRLIATSLARSVPGVRAVISSDLRVERAGTDD